MKSYSVPEVAAKIGVSRQTVLVLIWRGKLRAHRPALRRYRISEDALNAYLSISLAEVSS